jgi:hypothetical protein
MARTPYVMLFVLVMGGAPAAKHWHDTDEPGTRSKHHERHDVDDEGDGRTERCLFEAYEVRVLTDYYGTERRSLPPGLQKKLYRTGHLPPGWERKIEPLPPVVEMRLALLPHKYRRGIIDGYALVYEPATRLIIDVTPLFGPR